MINKTEGIVLKLIKYKDSLGIVDMYTRHSGRVSFGVNISKSKKAKIKSSLFQPFSILEVVSENKGQGRWGKLKEAKNTYPLSSIPYHPYKSAIALFLSEFISKAIKEEVENKYLFDYIKDSIVLLDELENDFANFHLVFLMNLTRFLGLYPNLEVYHQGDFFDLIEADFSSQRPPHRYYISAYQSQQLAKLSKMNYRNIHLFKMNREERSECLDFIHKYYKLHVPNFSELKSLEILKELFD